MTGIPVMSIITLQLFSLGQEQLWQRRPLKVHFPLCAHISVHISPSHTGTPEPSLLHTGLVLACWRKLWRYACSQQLWWLRQLVLWGLGACWRPGWGKIKGKLNFDIIQRSRGMEHMEKEGVIMPFGLQHRVVRKQAKYYGTRKRVLTSHFKCLK